MCDEFEAFVDVPDPDYEEVEFPFAFDDVVVEASSGVSDE